MCTTYIKINKQMNIYIYICHLENLGTHLADFLGCVQACQLLRGIKQSHPLVQVWSWHIVP